MSTNKQMIDLAIIQYQAEYETLPEISVIEDMTGLNAITVIRNLDYDYPEELKITKIERRILDAYKENQSLVDLAKELHLDYNEVANTVFRIRKKGLIFKNEKRAQISNGDSVPTYIEIISDLNFEVSSKKSINLRGYRGYVEDKDPKMSKAIIHINKLPYVVPITKDQVKIIGGHTR